MTEPRPCLLLLLLADWGAIPEGLAELRRCLAEDYGASLVIRIATPPLRSPMPLYAGYRAKRNVRGPTPHPSGHETDMDEDCLDDRDDSP